MIGRSKRARIFIAAIALAAAIAAAACGSASHGAASELSWSDPALLSWSDPALGDVVTGQVPFQVAPTQEPSLRYACEPLPPLPELDVRFAPVVSGDISLISARGDARVWAPDSSLWVRAPDGSFVAVAEWGGAIAVWRSHDGALDHLAVCPGGALYAETIAVSPDQRWIVVSGWRSSYRRDDPVTCIVDRQFHTTRALRGEIIYPSFDLADGVVIGRNRGFRLETGAEISCEERTPPPSEAFLRAHHIAPSTKTREVTVSHDGRYLAGWSRANSLAVWDLSSGEVLWAKSFQNGERCMDWRFSADDRFLEATPGRAPAEERIAVATGEATRLPGDALTTKYSYSYKQEPRGTLRYHLHEALSYIERVPPRTAVARSPDGAAAAAIDPAGRLAIERHGRCVGLGMDLVLGDPVAFSPDGSLLYASQVLLGNMQHGSVFGTVSGLWRSDTGALVRALNVKHQYMTYFMPAAARVAFGPVGGDERSVGSAIHLVEPSSGRELGALQLPSRGIRQPNAAGTSWLLDSGYDILLWDTGDPRPTRRLTNKRAKQLVSAAAFSQDSRLIAAGMIDGEIAVWSRDGQSRPVAARHDGYVERLAFSSDGRWLATAGSDHTVRVIDVATGAALGTVALTADRATLLWWSPHDDRLVIDTERHFQITIAPAH